MSGLTLDTCRYLRLTPIYAYVLWWFVSGKALLLTGPAVSRSMLPAMAEMWLLQHGNPAQTNTDSSCSDVTIVECLCVNDDNYVDCSRWLSRQFDGLLCAGTLDCQFAVCEFVDSDKQEWHRYLYGLVVVRLSLRCVARSVMV
jgi:hypothetical protein